MKLSSRRLAQISALLFPICGLAFAACGGSSGSPANTAGASGASATPSAGNGNGTSGSGTSGGNGNGTSGGSGSGDPSKLVGSFQVQVTPKSTLSEATTSILGKIYDGPTPVTTIWETEQEDGDCKLSTPRVPYCATPCGGTAACVEDDVCLPYPTAHSAGEVTVTGVKAADGSSSLVLTPINNNYQAAVPLAYPPFAAGDAVTLSAAGDHYPAFTLSSKGIAPLALTFTKPALKTGQALPLTWTKGSESSAKIHVKLDISHHGGSKGKVECDTVDSGALTISAALVTKLLNLGVAGFPTVIVTRHVSGSTVIPPGRVELEISSTVEEGVAIDGLKSCTDKTHCDEGQECQDDLTCK